MQLRAGEELAQLHTRIHTVCVYTHTCVCKHVCVYTRIHTYAHTCNTEQLKYLPSLHTHTHKHIQTCTHTYITAEQEKNLLSLHTSVALQLKTIVTDNNFSKRWVLYIRTQLCVYNTRIYKHWLSNLFCIYAADWNVNKASCRYIWDTHDMCTHTHKRSLSICIHPSAFLTHTCAHTLARTLKKTHYTHEHALSLSHKMLHSEPVECITSTVDECLSICNVIQPTILCLRV
jgi:hypothetical protein